MTSSCRIRPLDRCDIGTILAIQVASSETAQWSAADYEKICAGSGYGVVAEEQGRIAGFLVGRTNLDEFEILNAAVRPENRRTGIGSLLLADALEKGRAAGAKAAFLEVRESNHAARAFYEHHGFRLAGRRPRYYANPVEDALVLSRPPGMTADSAWLDGCSVLFFGAM